MTLMLVTKAWKRVVDAFIEEGVESGAIIVRGLRDMAWPYVAQRERRALATRVVFLLNTTQVRENACNQAVNLVVVDIPEGVERITNLQELGAHAFRVCSELKSMTIPGLTSKDWYLFIRLLLQASPLQY